MIGSPQHPSRYRHAQLWRLRTSRTGTAAYPLTRGPASEPTFREGTARTRQLSPGSAPITASPRIQLPVLGPNSTVHQPPHCTRTNRNPFFQDHRATRRSVSSNRTSIRLAYHCHPRFLQRLPQTTPYQETISSEPPTLQPSAVVAPWTRSYSPRSSSEICLLHYPNPNIH